MWYLSKRAALCIVFVQSLVATLGSLYFSSFGDPVANLLAGNIFALGGGFQPCQLCWFARILMYPLVLLSYVALVQDDEHVMDSIGLFSLLGIMLELYHLGIQKLPELFPATCGVGNPCSGSYINYFGFVTIPMFCLLAFIVIFLTFIIRKASKYNKMVE